MAFIEVSRAISKSFRRPARRARCCTTSRCRSSAASSSSIVGTMGCGKSTLLKIVAGLLAPDAGTVTIDGELVTRRPSGRGASCFRTTRCCRGSRRSRTCGWRSARRFPTGRRRSSASRPRGISRWSASARRSTGGPASCRAACVSAWRSPARLRSSRRCCFSTSRSARSTR